ncbi:iron complex outermembrane recepter protein [uncultured Thiomicrorhabdus sp.]
MCKLKPILMAMACVIPSISSAVTQPIELEQVSVQGHYQTYIGESVSTSEGSISEMEIQQRPLMRVGEVLEFVPGMAVTQHSGSGKANQYFLRGFNLDHGTDFSITVDGMPLNMRTHGHGQGYLDMNFIIPEMIKRMDYQKGVYYPQNGDFSSAGAAHIYLPDALDSGLASLEIGEYGYQRAVFMDAFNVNDTAKLLLALEGHAYQGPWTDLDEDVQKKNQQVRYVDKTAAGQYSLTLMAYDNAWNSADQIPQRAVTQGLIDPFGSLNTSVGGESSRYSLSGQWQGKDGFSARVYAIRSKMNLWSDFTYYLENPTQGDEFEQVDDRTIYGGDLKYRQDLLGNWSGSSEFGMQWRYDDIHEVALYNTEQRQRFNTIRKDQVKENSIGLYAAFDLDLSEKLSLTLGGRYDYFSVDVNSDLAVNSGTTDEGVASLKGGLRYLLNERWELYANAGQGFHSNDARGATIQIDPVSGDAIEPVDLLVPTLGAEIGVRFAEMAKWNTSLAFWWLQLDSELLFVGDAGNTEASRPSERYGVEFAGYYRLQANTTFDFEMSYTESRFTDQFVGEGKYIDGALPMVISAGISHMPKHGWRESLRLRYLGERPLNSDNSVRSKSSVLLNGSVGYAWSQWQIDFEVFNLLDRKDHDIAYYYTSRLSGEPSDGVEDIHFHLIEPRSVRLKVQYRF